MSIFLVLSLGLLAIVILLRCRRPIGLAILGGGAVMWALSGAPVRALVAAAQDLLTQSRTYDLLLALYFVMCLEVALRRSGTLKGLVESLNALFSSTRLTISLMPAFLGLLPSMGGARFSAPIVEQAAQGSGISAEAKAGINYWFRHVCEFMSPIIPGIILACAVADISVGTLVVHLAWLAPLAFAIGWLVLIRPLDVPPVPAGRTLTRDERRACFKEMALALGPVVLNVVLMLGAGAPAGVSMGLVSALTYVVLRACGRGVPLRTMLVEAFDVKLLLNITAILYFISLLSASGVLGDAIAALQSSPLPPAVVIALMSTLVGVLTGMSQGHAAIVMPVVAAMAPGDLTLAGIVMVFGVAGQMMTPTHVCLMITVDYFKSDFFKTLAPILLMEAILLTLFSLYTYCFG